MRTRTAALALIALLNLAACAGDPTVTRSSPCAVETSQECQIYRYSMAP